VSEGLLPAEEATSPTLLEDHLVHYPSEMSSSKKCDRKKDVKFTFGSSSKPSLKRGLTLEDADSGADLTPAKDEKVYYHPPGGVVELSDSSCSKIGHAIEKGLRPYLKTMSVDCGVAVGKNVNPALMSVVTAIQGLKLYPDAMETDPVPPAVEVPPPHPSKKKRVPGIPFSVSSPFIRLAAPTVTVSTADLRKATSPFVTAAELGKTASALGRPVVPQPGVPNAELQPAISTCSSMADSVFTFPVVSTAQVTRPIPSPSIRPPPLCVKSCSCLRLLPLDASRNASVLPWGRVEGLSAHAAPPSGSGSFWHLVDVFLAWLGTVR